MACVKCGRPCRPWWITGRWKLALCDDCRRANVALMAMAPKRRSEPRKVVESGRIVSWPPREPDVEHTRADPCVYCGGPGQTRDHIVPRSAGGGRDYNLAPACRRCNEAKLSTPLLIFLGRGAGCIDAPNEKTAPDP